MYSKHNNLFINIPITTMQLTITETTYEKKSNDMLAASNVPTNASTTALTVSEGSSIDGENVRVSDKFIQLF